MNSNKNYSLRINDNNIDYNEIIEHSFIDTFKSEDFEFKISFIKWKRNIGDKYYYYFLNEDLKIVDRQFTSFNNKTEDFHHSVYISSNYFDSYLNTKKNDLKPTFEEFGKTKNDRTFKNLIGHLNKLVGDQEKVFVRNTKANKLIENFKKNSVFPKFRNNTYDQIREKDLETVVKEIYCLNPNIFQGLKIQQSKTIVGFLNLLLDSEQRDNILSILDNLLELNDNERAEFAKLLEETKISHITSLVNHLKHRLKVITILKKLVFEYEKVTTERDNIQKIIENNYWIFGEQYHLVAADINFEQLLNNYLAFIEDEKKTKEFLTSKNRLKRPDIFIARKSQSNEVLNDELSIEENIIVELKRPSVIISKSQYDQVEEYIRYIISTPSFNSDLRKWKVILVGKSVDDWIKDQYESQKNKGKKFLVQSVKNYEIYAYTWDDLFQLFDIRHKHLIENLDFKEVIIESLCEIYEDDEIPNILTSNALGIQPTHSVN